MTCVTVRAAGVWRPPDRAVPWIGGSDARLSSDIAQRGVRGAVGAPGAGRGREAPAQEPGAGHHDPGRHPAVRVPLVPGSDQHRSGSGGLTAAAQRDRAGHIPPGHAADRKQVVEPDSRRPSALALRRKGAQRGRARGYAARPDRPGKDPGDLLGPGGGAFRPAAAPGLLRARLGHHRQRLPRRRHRRRPGIPAERTNLASGRRRHAGRRTALPSPGAGGPRSPPPASSASSPTPRSSCPLP